MDIAEEPISGAELCVWGKSPAHRFQGLFCKMGECRREVEEFSEVHACFQDSFFLGFYFYIKVCIGKVTPKITHLPMH